MDNHFNNFHRLTFRSRLYNFWHRCTLYVTGVWYTLKLLHFTYRNVLVLRHFQRCRKVEAAAIQKKKARFPYLDFYKRTWQQSRKLFTPVRTTATPILQPRTLDQHQSQPLGDATDIEKVLPPRSWSREPDSEWTGSLTTATSLSTHSVHQDADSSTPTKRKRHRIRAALRKGILALWHAPHFLLRKLGMCIRTYMFKIKLRGLYQRQQLELLRERQHIITATQTALFLSLANAIDLYTTRELATLCQHVSRARRKRKVTAEDLACFDQSVTDLDNNHETLRHAA